MMKLSGSVCIDAPANLVWKRLAKLEDIGLWSELVRTSRERRAAMSTWKLACLCAVSDGVPRRSLVVALIVGTVLNLINQGDAILAMASVNWLKAALTYCVPYLVCTYGAVSLALETRSGPSAVTPPRS